MNVRKEDGRAKALSSIMIRFFANYKDNSLYVSTPKTGPHKCYDFILSCRTSLLYEDLLAWWDNDDERGYKTFELDPNAIEILPTQKETTMPAITLKDLFENDFCVNINYDEDLTEKVVELFKDARDLGAEYTIDEVFGGTWMVDETKSDVKLSLGSWDYIGILNGRTFISDHPWGEKVELTVEQFEVIIKQANSEQSALTLTSGSPLWQVDTQKSVIVLGDNISVSGGVVVVNYKSGKQYHLYQNGKATFDVQKRTVTTEHTFLKDGQKAYERVEIDITTLDSIEADSVKLSFLEGNKVALTTTYVL